MVYGIVFMVLALVIWKLLTHHTPSNKDTYEELRGQYSADLGLGAAVFRNKKSEKRGDLLTHLTDEEQKFTLFEAQIETASLRKQIHLSSVIGEARQELRNQELREAIDLNTFKVTTLATDRGLDSLTYGRLALAEGESKIRVSEHRQLKQADLDIKVQELMETWAIALKYQRIEHELFDEIRARLRPLIAEKHEILEKGRKAQISAKEMAEQLELIEAQIEAYRSEFYAYARRIAEGNTGKETVRTPTVAEFVPVGGSRQEGDEEPLQTPGTGDVY
jgi:hypothetical protein